VYEIESSWFWYSCYSDVLLYSNDGNIVTGVVVGLELKAGVLDKNFLWIVVIGKVLERLLFFYKSNWKVIDLVV